MKTSRLEAFTDGVMAIIITIMVLELKAPEEVSLSALIKLLPTLISYLVSFIYVGIYWNSHHHLFQITESVNGKILWANLHLLFWLSLIPFTTSWIGENHIEALPIALYGVNFLFTGIAYNILKKSILTHHGEESAIYKAIADNKKEYWSLSIYLLGIGLSFVNSYISIFCYVFVGVIWFIPEKRIENKIK